MKIKNIFKRRQKEIKKNEKRRYDAASKGRLYSSWTTQNVSADNEIKSDLENLRARSRELQQNNDYAKRYLKLCVVNIVGAEGIKVQLKVKNNSGSIYKTANDKIESAWKDWGKAENCSVDESLSWRDMQRMIIETVARDGECLIMIIEGIGKHNFMLKVLEADHLDINYNDSNMNIKMGIKYDSWGKPVSYFIFKQHPGSLDYVSSQMNKRIEVPASNMIHLFVKERPSQTRGVPWMHSAMTRLNMLGGYEEAEVVNARVSAQKMGFFVNPTGDEYKGDDTDSNDDIIVNGEPGTFEQLPEGWDFKSYDPQHPAGNFAPFMKRVLMGISSGLGVAYNSLANDLESVNYSSIRAGTIEERDKWESDQKWFIESFIEKIFSRWLYIVLSIGIVDLDFSKYDKFNSPVFFSRTWDWVDPLKDARAVIEQIDAGIKTKTDVLAAQGKDIEDVMQTIAQEKELAEFYGLTFGNTETIKEEVIDEEETSNDEEDADGTTI